MARSTGDSVLRSRSHVSRNVYTALLLCRVNGSAGSNYVGGVVDNLDSQLGGDCGTNLGAFEDRGVWNSVGEGGRGSGGSSLCGHFEVDDGLLRRANRALVAAYVLYGMGAGA